ncbi:zincin-like metallopeptidase domain-containing protein, partial [Kingella kingae]|uniref:ArdC family protein n=1 Tax=Kingella kingae TaxID=504 RepID=UPI0025515ED4
SGWANRLPYNTVTGKHYNGVNVLTLLGKATFKGYEKGAWLTFKQAQSVGGNVKKGEKGTKVVYFDLIKVKDKETGEDEVIPMLKSFTVFNIAQCENLDFEKLVIKGSEQESEAVKDIQEIEEIASSFGVKIAHCETLKAPCYIRSQDEIRMPHKEQFQTTENYYATLLHELVHSTGHESRLNRQFGKRFGDDAYAFEELIAELGAAFLCADFGLIGATVENHAAYLQSWLHVLRNDKKAIFTAASQAGKAAELIRKCNEAENELLAEQAA